MLRVFAYVHSLPKAKLRRRETIRFQSEPLYNRKEDALTAAAAHSSLPCRRVSQVVEAQNNPSAFVRKGFSLASVAKNEELLRPASAGRSTRLVLIDIISGDSTAG